MNTVVFIVCTDTKCSAIANGIGDINLCFYLKIA